MNPLWLAKLIPVAIGAAIGFVLAWGIQSLRLTSAEQEFTAFKQEQVRIYQEAQHDADTKREQASKKYDAARAELASAVGSGEVFRRCVAAGKCGVRVLKQSTCAAGNGIQAAPSLDATGPNAVFAPAGTAAEDPVIGDCAITTLMNNQLQEAIEAQKGYEK